ncbi:thioredoxin family protein [Alloiococcus sp. CFN-8]|uniref:thioredoxin family protein n=1 Tax=Alloiococcus sp. CFN-8 TaxID=3416081 RepID=UPI003CF0F00C
MIKLNSKEAVEDFIRENTMAIIYFTGSQCGACELIKLKVEEIIKSFPKLKGGEINGEEELELASSYGVFSLPTFFLYVEGKETLRYGRNINLLELQGNIQRYYEMLFQ